jgi:hypothetical protein
MSLFIPLPGYHCPPSFLLSGHYCPSSFLYPGIIALHHSSTRALLPSIIPTIRALLLFIIPLPGHYCPSSFLYPGFLLPFIIVFHYSSIRALWPFQVIIPLSGFLLPFSSFLYLGIIALHHSSPGLLPSILPFIWAILPFLIIPPPPLRSYLGAIPLPYYFYPGTSAPLITPPFWALLLSRLYIFASHC